MKPINFKGTKVNYSNHALTRSKQRCIPLEVVDFLYDYAVIAEGGSPKDPSKYLRQLDKYLS